MGRNQKERIKALMIKYIGKGLNMSAALSAAAAEYQAEQATKKLGQ